MLNNKMEEVANLLGLELEEEFKIEGLFGNFKLSKEGLKQWSKGTYDWLPSSLLEELITGHAQIIKLSKPILNEAERKYLSAIIKPFRDKVVSIAKYRYSDDNSYIQITVEQIAFDGEFIDLPRFKSDAMYKDMRAGKQYTLEELDL